MKKIIYSITDLIFSNSQIFDKFRSLIHNNFEDEKNVIHKNFDKNKVTLDFGCGAGQFSILFNPDKYHGVDTDSKYIKFCKSKYKGKFSVINTSPPYNLKNNYFDQILISSVIHHIDDESLIKISKELKRIIKKGGRLMIADHFVKKDQKNMFCKLLIYLDRGKYFRNPDRVIKLFSRNFKVKKFELFRNDIYKDYMLISSKR
jgi:SAM-dependent methyltransferase